MIRIEIVANNLRAAEELAAILAADEHLEVVSARALGPGYRPAAYTEVIVALHVGPVEVPRGGPKVVSITHGPQSPRAGSAGRAWLPAEASPAEIVAAVVAADADLFGLTEQQVGAAFPGETELDRVQERLTAREIEVLRMMADGLANKEIADRLGISPNTAKFHVAQVLAKLSVSSRTEAVRAGIRRGLVAI